jgi:hypothetical protein
LLKKIEDDETKNNIIIGIFVFCNAVISTVVNNVVNTVSSTVASVVAAIAAVAVVVGTENAFL